MSSIIDTDYYSLKEFSQINTVKYDMLYANTYQIQPYSALLSIFKRIVSKDILSQFFKATKHFQKNDVTEKIINDLNRVLTKYKFDSSEKLQMFMATIAHESKSSLVEIFATQMAKEGLVKLNTQNGNPIISPSGGAEYVAKYFPLKATGSHWNAQENNLNNRIEKGELSFYQVSQVINFGSVKYYGEKNPK